MNGYSTVQSRCFPFMTSAALRSNASIPAFIPKLSNDFCVNDYLDGEEPQLAGLTGKIFNAQSVVGRSQSLSY